MVSWLLGRPRASTLDPLDDRYYEFPSGTLSRSGVRVSADSAMRSSAVYRCVSILANILAMFPKGMFERQDRGRREAPEHPLDPIISFRPNRRQCAFEFWQAVCYHLVLRQNAYVQIVAGSSGRGWVGELVPLHPDRIMGPEELPNGRLRYEYRRPSGEKIVLLGGVDLWHIHGLSSDGLKGLSMLDVANDSIGLTLAAERHAARFFDRGVKPTGILQHEKRLSADTAQEMSESFGRLYGGEEGTGRVPVLWEGMKFQPVSMTLKDAEFLDSRKFGVAEIARWFGVPPHMVGDVERSTSWGTGIEQQGLHFLIYSLLPWIELLEQSIRFTLVVQPERFYPKFNVNAILRMDAKAQADMFAVLIDKGVLNPNECRELLDRNPRPGGDEYASTAKPVATVTAPISEPQDDQPEDEPPEDDGNRETPGSTLLRAMVEARVRDLLDEEAGHLTRLAKKHAKDGAAWGEDVRRLYGRFAGRITATLCCSEMASKGWCDARRDLVLGEGIASLTGERQTEAGMALVALALSNGGNATC